MNTQRGSHSSLLRMIVSIIARIVMLLAVLGTLTRLVPSQFSDIPYLPAIISLMPWFALASAIALVLGLLSRRWTTALIALVCLCAQLWWQYPFFTSHQSLPSSASAVTSTAPNTTDAYARVMTFNVYKGRADAQSIVNTVKNERVEVLALQETTDDFITKLDQAGLSDYLPYSKVSSSDNHFGNGIWSATQLTSAVKDQVNSSASYMPAGTVALSGGKSSIRFISVHTTSPTSGNWKQWKRSLSELQQFTEHADVNTKYVLMGDFNATYDHAPFRDFLGSRFSDAARTSGAGFTLTWPSNREYIPRLVAIDHIVTDQGVSVGNVKVLPITGSDHAALLSTLYVQ
ncbi:MAG: endonuclease/exonuclease/phosphatase family protein [Bifidobacterium sp.]|nr:endonuclease/exonuclease/phosphatase family protein [Bifidobacterium sp.]MCH4175694.1 endonuclease/exonuclease/phosphatase family protein [Bifidobacterium sp.]